MNDLIRPTLYDAHHPIVPVKEPVSEAPAIRVDIVGPICESGDVLAAQRPLPPVEAGDLLAIGATVTATLNADGTTSGRLQVPGGVGGQGAIDENLAGTWSLSGTTVTFSPSASSLLTDVDFAVGPNTLTGEGIYMGAVLLLVLTRDE